MADSVGQPVQSDALKTSRNVSLKWQSLGRKVYDEALTIQMDRAQALLDEADDVQTVYTVEHPPTITIGRNGTFNHIVATRDQIESLNMTVVEVDRGGDVTYHGPGQWVVYPVLHLNPWGNDVGAYVRLLEECVIVALDELGIRGARIDGLPGVWVGTNKICAVGARVKRRHSGEFVTAHGLALNVNTDLSHFGSIVPCGISDKGVTSIAALLGQDVAFDEWEVRLRRAFCTVF
jgi:lipoyl(octanoyl) transferase